MSFPISAVAEVKLKDSQYTLDHVRAFGMYNYLHLDPWYEDSVYFVDSKGRLLNLTVTLVGPIAPYIIVSFILYVCLRWPNCLFLTGLLSEKSEYMKHKTERLLSFDKRWSKCL